MSGTYELKGRGETNLGYNNSTDSIPGQEKPLSDNDVDVELNGQPPADYNPTDGKGESYSFDPTNGDLILPKKTLKEGANSCAKAVAKCQTLLTDFLQTNKSLIWIVIGVILLGLYVAYVVYSLADRGLGDEEEQWRLLICTSFGVFLLILHLGQRGLEPCYKAVSTFKTNPRHARLRFYVQWVLYIVSTITTVTLIIVLVALDTPENLVSLAGLAALLLICYLTSYSPAMIDWHPVFWGFSIQFYFAVIILKTQAGYEAFNWLGDRVTEFLAYTDAGASFVFGGTSDLYLIPGTTIKIKDVTMKDGSDLPLSSLTLDDESKFTFLSVFRFHFFAFAVMPVVVFFSAFIAIMFYLGVMNFVVTKVGYFLSFCLGTTPAESLNAAGNIFIGMAESPLMIRPFVAKMTSSELHAVMTGGFATIAGSVLGVYIGFGVPADHLLTASVMSAPAALAISKITYPEIEIPVLEAQDMDKIEKMKESNVIEAACNGAVMSAKVVASMLVNVIAFLSLLKFVNATLTWFGDRAGVEELTFELICSYVLYPIALFMGTHVDDCRRVAELVGVKTFTNEFIAFDKLSVLLKNRKKFDAYLSDFPNGTWHKDGDDIFLHQLGDLKLAKGTLERRSEVIATYALCGFSNFGSMGILLGVLSAMAPNRTPTLSKLIFRAMIAGNIACFFTACIAGLFYEEFD